VFGVGVAFVRRYALLLLLSPCPSGTVRTNGAHSGNEDIRADELSSADPLGRNYARAPRILDRASERLADAVLFLGLCRTPQDEEIAKKRSLF